MLAKELRLFACLDLYRHLANHFSAACPSFIIAIEWLYNIYIYITTMTTTYITHTFTRMANGEKRPQVKRPVDAILIIVACQENVSPYNNNSYIIIISSEQTDNTY